MDKDVQKAIDAVRQISGKDQGSVEKQVEELKKRGLYDQVLEVDRKYGEEISKVVKMKDKMTTDEKAEMIMEMKKNMTKTERTKFDKMVDKLSEYVKKNK